MTQPFWEFPLRLPRHAFSARDAARAADVWRCFQEAAVEASTLAGWAPQRYRAEQKAFVVRSMTVVHVREAEYGERTRARTWVSRFRRDMFSTREVRLFGEMGPVASATQEWVFTTARLEPVRADASLTDCFPVHDEGPSIALPAWDEREGPTHRFDFEAWWTWMDPLDHVNHPGYLDFCDEAISRRMAAVGLAPVALRPVAEKLTFKAGVMAGDRVRITSRMRGLTPEGHLVLAHTIAKTAEGGAEIVCVEGTTIRTLASGDPARLVAAFAAE